MKKGIARKHKSSQKTINKMAISTYLSINTLRGFPGGSVVKNLPFNAGDMGSIPGPGRSHMLWSN